MTSPDPEAIGSPRGAWATNGTPSDRRSPRDSRGLGAGWPRSRVEVPRGSGSRLSGPRDGLGPRPARRALSGHRHHAQERKAPQVPGPRRLLGPRWARGGAGGGGGWAAGSGGLRRAPAGSGGAGETRRARRLCPGSEEALALCSVSVTVADYANSDPAVVRSGRIKKAVANAIQQEGRRSWISLGPSS